MITKRDDRRYRFALAMDSYRTLWARIAFKQVAKAHKFDRNHVTLIMRRTDAPEAALERIKTYFEAISNPARVSLNAPMAALWTDDSNYAEYLAATFEMLLKQSVPADQRTKELLEGSPQTLDG